jgi:hypothetical protein
MGALISKGAGGALVRRTKSLRLLISRLQDRPQGCEDSHLYAVHPTKLKRFRASSEPRRVTVELSWARQSHQGVARRAAAARCQPRTEDYHQNAFENH